MEKIIYQTKVFTGINTLLCIFMGSLFIYIAVYNDSASMTDYLGVLFMLMMFWLLVMTLFNKFTLTENEFRVECPPIAFVLKPKRIHLKDIEKLVFKQGARGVPEIEIYRINKEQDTGFRFFTESEPKSYNFSIDYDDIKRLIAALKSKGVQVECIGVVWGKGGLLN